MSKTDRHILRKPYPLSIPTLTSWDLLFSSDLFCKTRSTNLQRSLQTMVDCSKCSLTFVSLSTFKYFILNSLKYLLTVWIFLVRLSLKPCSAAFLEPVATLRSCAGSLVCLLLKPKSAWNQNSCSLVKLVLASADVQINFFFGLRVDKGVSAWFLITPKATLWSVVGVLISSSTCEILFCFLGRFVESNYYRL